MDIDFNFKKKWGQNFLTNMEVIIDVVQYSELNSEDIVLEIGPGSGQITEFIIENVKKTILVEVDREAIVHLTNKFSQYLESDKLIIIHGDILSIDTLELIEKNGINKLIGALPYNISKQIIAQICRPDHYLDSYVFILQKEVAQDYAAINKKLTQLNCIYSEIFNIYYLKTIEKSSFKPVPKVDSGLIKFVPQKNPNKDLDFNKYARFVNLAFQNKRKMFIKNLRNHYKDVDWEKQFVELGIDEKIRVEQLTRTQLVQIYTFLTEN